MRGPRQFLAYCMPVPRQAAHGYRPVLLLPSDGRIRGRRTDPRNTTRAVSTSDPSHWNTAAGLVSVLIFLRSYR